GVFQRHPTLKFLFTETSTTWVLPELAQIDGFYHSAKIEGSMMSVIMRPAVELLDRSPSDYFRRNCWIGNSVMSRADVDLRHDLGVDRIVWGSDYPHMEGSWPHSLLALRLNLHDVPADEVRAMTSENAAKVYGFDLDALQPIADRIGPTPEEIATPVSPGELPAWS